MKTRLLTKGLPAFVIAVLSCTVVGCLPRPGLYEDELDTMLSELAFPDSYTPRQLYRMTEKLLVGPPDDERLTQALATAEHAVLIAPGYASRWRAARAASYLAHWYSDPALRLAAARRGLDHARAARDQKSEKVAGHYFMAVNMGLIAQMNPDGALARLQEIVRLAERAREIDDSFQQGGPLRILGALYATAPPWPTSIGDIEESEELLEEVVERFPDYPLNHYMYGETLMRLSLSTRAAAAFRATLSAPPVGIWRLEGPHFRIRARQRLADIERVRALRNERL